MKKAQWWLHEMADKITIFALRRQRGWGGGRLALRMANLLDRVAMQIGGHTW